MKMNASMTHYHTSISRNIQEWFARGQAAASGFARERIDDVDKAIYAVVDNTLTSVKQNL